MSLPFDSLVAATAPGPGATRDLERVARNHTFVVIVTGNPNESQTVLEGSHDSVNWFSLDFIGTDSDGPYTVAKSVGTHLVRYVRARVSTLVGGATPTVSATIASGEE